MLDDLIKGLPGDLPTFVRRFGNDAQCRAYLVRARWPTGFGCGGCGHGRAYSHKLRLIEELDTGDLEFLSADRADFAYPVQIIRFGNDLMFLAMGSEVIVDYEMRFLRAQDTPTGAHGPGLRTSFLRRDEFQRTS